jgi:asparagine synthase (glutamine-hydrolysing)
MPFIHGQIDWSAQRAATMADVRSMVRAVDGHPWSSSAVEDVETRKTHCVFACQVERGSACGALRIGPAVTTRAPISVVADLQLYDRGALGSQLGIAPSEARDLDDLSLILAAYDRWGSGFADRLLAEGTLAIYDRRRHQLVCWRDPAGVRPLYYRHLPGRSFIFSSDLTSLSANAGIPGVADLPYLRSLLEAGGRFSHPSRTLLEGVRKLPAGHLLIVDDSGLRIDRYWRPNALPERRYPSDRDYVEKLREILEQAVACRVLGREDQVGAHLSGGLDSSSLAVLAARVVARTGRTLTGFSWAPPRERVAELDGDERLLAEAAARYGKVDLRYTTLLPHHVADVTRTDRALRPVEAMRYEAATSRLAVEFGLHTMISGWGGDEGIVWNGTGYFADLARRGRWLKAQRELRLRAALHEGGPLLGAWKRRVVTPLLPDRALYGLGWLERPSTRGWPAELRPEVIRSLADVQPLIAPPGQRERPGVRRMQIERLTGGALQYRMEAWASHGALLGLTYTFPLLDKRIIEFALSIPDRLYFKDGWKRWLYRTAMDGILPDAVRWNPDKYDDAAIAQSRLVATEVAERHREMFRERSDNPFVDVELLLAPDRDPNGWTGTAAWMAFTGLRLP